jgi:hypothetical protein
MARGAEGAEFGSGQRFPFSLCHLFQDLHPFSAHLRLEMGEPGHVTTRMRHALDEATADRIGDHYKNNRRIAVASIG